jgi:hypothetical protein
VGGVVKAALKRRSPWRARLRWDWRGFAMVGARVEAGRSEPRPYKVKSASEATYAADRRFFLGERAVLRGSKKQ